MAWSACCCLGGVSSAAAVPAARAALRTCLALRDALSPHQQPLQSQSQRAAPRHQNSNTHTTPTCGIASISESYHSCVRPWVKVSLKLRSIMIWPGSVSWGWQTRLVRSLDCTHAVRPSYNEREATLNMHACTRMQHPHGGAGSADACANPPWSPLTPRTTRNACGRLRR